MTLLERAFAEHEYLAPDADHVLEAIHDRIRTRRRSRLAVAGAVAGVAVIAAGAIAVSTGSRPHGAASSTPAASPRKPVPAPDYLTIGAGWLPPGTVTERAVMNDFGTQMRAYAVTAHGRTTYVSVQTIPDRSLPTKIQGKAAYNVSINGRPGRESGPDVKDMYIVFFAVPANRVAEVDVAVGGSASARAAIGRQVAQHLDLSRNDRIPADYKLSYVPAALAIRAVGHNPAARGVREATSYTLASPDSKGDDTGSIRIVEGQDPSTITSPEPTWIRGRSVQGRPTYYAAGKNLPLLRVDDVRPGVSISIEGSYDSFTKGSASAIPELYRIADGLILP